MTAEYRVAKRPGGRVQIDDFRIDNVRQRIKRVGDLWKPLLLARGRVDLRKYLP